jgi:outer membrane immunogenic protein
MFIKRILIAGAFVVGTAFAANAADLPHPPMAAPAPPPPPMAAPAFDWSGPYIGAYGGLTYGLASYYEFGVQAGFNMVRGKFLAGIEAQVGAIWAGGFGYEVAVNSRLGFILGQRFLLYAQGGVGFNNGVGLLWTAMAGMEFAIGDTWSLFAEGGYAGAFGGGLFAYVFQAGVNWHR